MKKVALFLVFILSLFTLISCDKNNPDGGEKLPPEDEKYEFKTPVTDTVTLDQTYEGLDFVDNGIGVATVVAYTDGDTAIFKTLNNHKITVRFQGIDTPESTYKVDPWGFAASAYTKNALKNATTIVLQAESLTERLDSTGKRYLAWVWVDGRLLNLEIAEVGLAQADASGTHLNAKFIEAIKPVMLAKERIYGAKDPDYDYSGTRTVFTIKELREKYGTEKAINEQTEKGKKISITGTITKMFGSASAYLQQYNAEDGNYYGIYVYGGYGQITKFKVGNTVIINGTLGYYYGQLQISSVTNASVEVYSYTNQDAVVETPISIADLGRNAYSMFGNLVTINEEMEITGYNDSEDKNSFTLRTNQKCGDGTYLSIRVDQNIALIDENGLRITTGEALVGKTIKEFKGIVAYYDGNYGTQSPEAYDGYVQLMWASYSDVTFK